MHYWAHNENDASFDFRKNEATAKEVVELMKTYSKDIRLRAKLTYAIKNSIEKPLWLRYLESINAIERSGKNEFWSVWINPNNWRLPWFIPIMTIYNKPAIHKTYWACFCTCASGLDSIHENSSLSSWLARRCDTKWSLNMTLLLYHRFIFSDYS